MSKLIALARTFARTIAGSFVAAAACCFAAPHGEAAPSIVYILADDLGWKDVGFHRGTIPTPHLDRLAREGAVLNALYAQPHSSQTHAAVMTGRYPMRYGFQTMSIVPANTFGLPKDERTLAEALKEAGYATAYIGHWRLGHARQEFWPTRRGFDHFFGSLSPQGQAASARAGAPQWRRDESTFPFKRGNDATDLLAKEAVRVVERHDKRRPLFMMLSLPVPASGEAPAQLSAQFRDVSDPARRGYAAAVAAMDRAVGEVVASLERAAMADQTLIVFHSDNGGSVPTRLPTGDGDTADVAADNGDFRGGKGSLYEGGVRVASVMRWPGRIRPETIVPQFLHVTDLTATVLQAAEAKTSSQKPLDGTDILPLIAGGQASPRKQMLINVEDFRGAVRVGDWKLILHAALPPKVELFNIGRDPEEAENVAAKYPDRAREMMTTLTEYAYDMAPSLYVEELVSVESDRRPIVWRQNPTLR